MILCDPPYGLEFMGKEWDKLDWQGGGGMSTVGIGDRAIPWPSHSQTNAVGTANATCARCGGRMRGANKCECEDPDWRVKGEPLKDTANADRMRRQQAWHEQWLREAYRVLPPGGVIKAFSGTRTYHRLAAAMESVGFVLDPDHSLEAWVYGCLSEDTEVLTPEGWVHYHRAKEVSLVAGFDPATGGVQWQEVEEHYEYHYDREAYRIFGERTDQIVSRNHRVLIESGDGLRYVLAEDLPSQVQVPVVENVPDLLQESRPQAERASRVTRSHMARVDQIHYRGVVWCVKVATGAFVARRNGLVFVTGNSGFPKSLNISKALDKHAGAEREVVGTTQRCIGPSQKEGYLGTGTFREASGNPGNLLTAPATEAAKRYEGWGTALKPAWEPILIGRKPE
jgi:hypothetical protein